MLNNDFDDFEAWYTFIFADVSFFCLVIPLIVFLFLLLFFLLSLPSSDSLT